MESWHAMKATRAVCKLVLLVAIAIEVLVPGMIGVTSGKVVDVLYPLILESAVLVPVGFVALLGYLFFTGRCQTLERRLNEELSGN
jgi:hypothetical protein